MGSNKNDKSILYSSVCNGTPNEVGYYKVNLATKPNSLPNDELLLCLDLK